MLDTASTPPRAVGQKRTSLTQRLADFFALHPQQWIDGRHLAFIAGAYAWRTRLSSLRRPPFSMSIENRVRKVTREDGSAVRVSEYRYRREEPPA